MMTKILCIDASTEACSVALLNDNEITESYQVAPRQHASLLLPLVEKLLTDASLRLNQLDALACHVGPGAFTGIRIGVSVAQGLAYGANIPTIAVSSLESLAQQAFELSDKTYCLAAIDARMNEVYYALYKRGEEGQFEPLINEQVIAPDAIDFSALEQFGRDDFVKIGSGWSAYHEIFCEKGLEAVELIDNKFPRAAAGLVIAKQKYLAQDLLSPEKLQPAYLRNKVAEKKRAKI